MKRHKILFAAVLGLTLAAATPAVRLHAQSEPAGAAGRASRSVSSGDRTEPEANESNPAEDLKKPSPAVAKLGHMVGLSPEASVVAFNWVNFLVLAAAVIYALVKALPKAFRSRTAHIQKNIVEAKVATEEARLRLSAVEARLGKLDDEIAALRRENEQAAAEEEKRIEAQVEEEKVRIVQSAEQEIAAASAAAQRSLRAYAAGIAVDRAAAQLHITPEDDRVLIESFAGRLGNEGSRN